LLFTSWDDSSSDATRSSSDADLFAVGKSGWECGESASAGVANGYEFPEGSPAADADGLRPVCN